MAIRTSLLDKVAWEVMEQITTTNKPIKTKLELMLEFPIGSKVCVTQGGSVYMDPYPTYRVVGHGDYNSIIIRSISDPISVERMVHYSVLRVVP